jgi:hypothetical protein
LCFHTDNPKRWDAEIRQNQGDSWCTCATCTSEIIHKVGCDSIDIRCEATDIDYIMASPVTEWDDLKACLQTKCPTAAMLLDDAMMSDSIGASAKQALGGREGRPNSWLAGLAVAGGLAVFVAAVAAWHRLQAQRARSQESDDDRLVQSCTE